MLMRCSRGEGVIVGGGMDKSLSIQQIRYFIAVVEYRNFTAAASSLYISQPALSKSIKQLEEDLGVQLIERSFHAICLTEAGSVFYDASVQFLNQYSDFLYDFKNRAFNPAYGRTKISIAGAILDAFFSDVICQFCREHPDIRVDIYDGDMEQIVKDLTEGVTDTGIIMLPYEQQDSFKIIPIIHDECHVVVHHTHPFAECDSVDIKRLVGKRIFTTSEYSKLYHTFVSICQSHNVEPDIVYRCSVPKVLLNLAALNLGAAILPRPVVIRNITSELVHKPLLPTVPWEVGLMYSKKRYISPATNLIIKYIQSYFNNAD